MNNDELKKFYRVRVDLDGYTVEEVYLFDCDLKMMEKNGRTWPRNENGIFLTMYVSKNEIFDHKPSEKEALPLCLSYLSDMEESLRSLVGRVKRRKCRVAKELMIGDEK